MDEKLKLVYKAGNVTVIRLFGVVAFFIFQLLITNYYGATVTGYFFLSWMIISVCSIIACLGLDVYLLRVIAIHASMKAWCRVNYLLQRSVLVVVAVSSILALLIVQYSYEISHFVFKEEALQGYLEMLAPICVIVSLSLLLAGALNAVGRNRSSAAINQLVPFGTALVITWLLSDYLDGALVFLGLIAGCIASLIWAYISLSKGLGDKDIQNNTHSKAGNVKYNFSFFLIQIFVQVNAWGSVAVVGFYLSAEDVGVYGIAQRLALSMSFILSSLNIIVAPKFSQYYFRKNYDALEKLSKVTSLLMVLVSTPLLLILIYFGEDLMAMFGEDFTKGWLVLIVLAGGQFVNAITGSVGFLLNMTGHEHYMRNLTVINAVMSIMLLLIMVPGYGLLGAAIASSVSVVFLNAAMTVIAYNKLGFSPLLGWYGKA